jgi:hypothetical protein
MRVAEYLFGDATAPRRPSSPRLGGFEILGR